MKTIETRNNWLVYNNHVLLLKVDKSQPPVRWQSNGTMCKQEGMRASLVKAWKTSEKWLNVDTWQTKTSWGHEYPEKIFFTQSVTPPEYYKLLNITSSEKINNRISHMCKLALNILNSILKDASSKSGLELSSVHDKPIFGRNWYEAYVPVQDLKGNKYILTWENCD